MLIPTGQKLPGANTGPIRPAPTGQQPGTLATQLGGASIEDFSDRGFGVAWNARGEVAFSGLFMEEIRLGNVAVRSRGGRDMLFGLYNAEQGFQWIRPLGSELPLEAIFDIAVDGEDNLIITGSAGEGTDFGRGPTPMYGMDDIGKRDLFIAKYTPEGELLWMDHADGNSILTGRFTGRARFGETILESYGGPNIFITRYNSAGELLWANRAGSPAREGRKLEQGNALGYDRDGNIVVTGGFAGQCRFEDMILDAGQASSDCFIAQYSAEGRLRWVHHLGEFGEIEKASGWGLDINAGNEIVVTGYFSGSLNILGKKFESVGEADLFMLVMDEHGRVLSLRPVIAFND